MARTKIERGEVRADAFPARPTKKKYTRRPINLMSVKSLAARIESIDLRIRNALKLRGERRRLSAKLMKLLKT